METRPVSDPREDGARGVPKRPDGARGVPKLWIETICYLLVAVLCAVIGISGLWSVFRVVPEYGSPWWTLATAVPAAALALTKRRAPATGCVVASILFGIDLTVTGGLVPLIVMLDLLYALTSSLAANERRRVLVAVAAITAAMTIAAMVLTGDLRITVVIGLQIGALLGTTYWYGTAVAQSRELVELHRRRAEDATRLAELDRSAAVRGERERMARELHDVVAGHVSAVAIRSEAALAAGESPPRDGGTRPAESGIAGPGSAGPSAERSALRAVRDSSLEAHEALRAMIRVLREGSGGLAAPPGHDRIEEMVAEAERSGVRVRLEDGLAGARIPLPVSQTVGRIVHEGLANAAKHAAGSDVNVRLGAEPVGTAEPVGAAEPVDAESPAVPAGVSGPAADPDGLDVRAVLVEIRSRGGSPLARSELLGSGMGLLMLEERVRALGGSLTAGREPAGSETEAVEQDHWVIRARIPIGAER